MERYNAAEIEPRWQKIWDEADVFRAHDNSDKPKFYALEMFPYPSGRIHMGHVRNYAMGDVIARYKKAQGYEVLHPMGWDAFGMPAENAAIEKNVHPKGWTYENIDAMRAPLKRLGFALDWSREFATCDTAYYKQQQAIFLKFMEKDLVYRKTAKVNWDPVDNTVLANEQVIDGKGWRSGAIVEQRDMDQWFFKITHYAEELLKGLDTLENWPEKVRTMQANWIGKSEGATVSFEFFDDHVFQDLDLIGEDLEPVLGGKDLQDWAIYNHGDEIKVFTTRPDTLFGASFIAISPDHPIAKEMAKHIPEIEAFRLECGKIGTTEEAIALAPKLGFDTGLKVRNPFTYHKGETLPVWIANFVLMGYGTGAVFGCPAHDQRDLDFARKFDLPVTPVICPPEIDPADFEITDTAYTGDGTLFNSSADDVYSVDLNGLSKSDGIKIAIDKLEDIKLGTREIQYRLRDWGVSRQRYWGCPIPIIYCEGEGGCGAVPVPAADLPVELPEDINFDKPGNPLDRHPTFSKVDCPSCGKPARRETDTLDTFADSSWYFARFAGGQGNGQPSDVPFDKKAASDWLPVDQYVGGVEHAVLHLLYARFFTRGLRDCGLLDLPSGEPFKGLFTQGMVTHAVFTDADGKFVLPADVDEKDGRLIHLETGGPVTKGDVIKMSKSKKNVVDPNDIIEGYGADVARWFVLSDSPPERDVEWTESGVIGAWRFSNKIWALVSETEPMNPMTIANEAKDDALALRRFAHKALEKITAGIEGFRFNTSVAQIYELSNALRKYTPNDAVKAECLGILIRTIAPFMPHLSEECWKHMGGESLCYHAPWPVVDPAMLVESEITMPIQVNGKKRGELLIAKDMDKDAIEKLALSDSHIQKTLEGLTIRKVIVVPGRIINIVAT